MSSSTDFDFCDDFGAALERGGSEIEGFVVRGTGAFFEGGGGGSGRDGGTLAVAATMSGVRVVLGASFDDDADDAGFVDDGAASRASVAPHDAQLAVPSDA